MNQVRTITTRIKDEFGGIFPQAFVAIHKWSESSQISGESKDCTADYDIDHDITDIAYTAMFKYDQTQQAMTWRKLLVKDGDTYTEKLLVDLDNPQVVAALQGVANPDERRARAIFADLKRRFA